MLQNAEREQLDMTERAQILKLEGLGSIPRFPVLLSNVLAFCEAASTQHLRTGYDNI